LPMVFNSRLILPVDLEHMKNLLMVLCF